MTASLVGAATLALGYWLWGGLAERAVAPDPHRPTPAMALADGVDCQVLVRSCQFEWGIVGWWSR